jgi:DUF4097 and DUF4098 domain-containing protein YvlB
MKRVLMVMVLVPAIAGIGGAETIKKDFDIGMGQKLELDLETGGGIYISGWDKEKVAVTVHVFGVDKDDYDLDFDARSSVIRIRSDYRRRWGRHDGDFEFDIKVPERFDIEVESSGGTVHIADVEGEISGGTAGGSLDFTNVNGNIDFRTMGGEIRASEIKGHLRLETMGGGITVTDSEADGKISTMGGNILIEHVKGNLKGSTMGGNVIYRDVTGRSDSSEDSSGEEVRISTMGGDIKVDEAPGGADLDTKGGDIMVRTAHKFVKAKTLGGDIEIDEIDGWISARTLGGDVTVNMTGDPDQGRRDVEISSLGGEIRLTVPPDLSMQFDIELAITKDARRDYEIISDFDMKQERTRDWDRSHGSKRKYIYGTGSVAGGKNKIEISTINGNIYIKKGT